jgi:hypothetical protein
MSGINLIEAVLVDLSKAMLVKNPGFGEVIQTHAALSEAGFTRVEGCDRTVSVYPIKPCRAQVEAWGFRFAKPAHLPFLRGQLHPSAIAGEIGVLDDGIRTAFHFRMIRRSESRANQIAAT